MKNFPGFFPRKDGERARWATNYRNKIELRGPEVSIPPAKIARLQLAAQRIEDVVMQVSKKKEEYDAVLSLRDKIIAEEGKVIGDAAVIMKRDPQYTDALGAEVGIVGGHKMLQRHTMSPKLNPVVYPNSIVIAFKKRYTEGISLYSRTLNTDGGYSEWEHIGFCRKSPFTDDRPMTQAGFAEVREYKACCVKFPNEIGQFSDIVSAVFRNVPVTDKTDTAAAPAE